MKVTVPDTSARLVALVSVSDTVTTSATVSLTVIVVDALPSGIEIGLPTTDAEPVTDTVAVYAGWLDTGFPSASCTWMVTVTLFAVPGAGSDVEMTTTCVAGPAMNVTVPETSAREVALVSVSDTVTPSTAVSFTVTVVEALPSGIEIGLPTTVADPVTDTVAV
jgi:hypothetical protein